MKLCECGCGALAPIARKTNTKLGWVKGEPLRFVHGHYARTPAHRARLTERNQLRRYPGDLNPGWKGDDAGYHSVHAYVRRHYQKTGVCEDCGREVGSAKGTGTCWANISGEYRREDRWDWRELCYRCHNAFDRARAS